MSDALSYVATATAFRFYRLRRAVAAVTLPWAVIVGATIIGGAIVGSRLVAPYEFSTGSGPVWRLDTRTGKVETCLRPVAQSGDSMMTWCR